MARRLVPKLVGAALWVLLALAIGLVVVMVWHPWVHPWTGIRR